jgi:hypothetical protein
VSTPPINPLQHYWDGFEEEQPVPSLPVPQIEDREDGLARLVETTEMRGDAQPSDTDGDFDEWDYSSPRSNDPRLLNEFSDEEEERTAIIPLAGEPDASTSDAAVARKPSRRILMICVLLVALIAGGSAAMNVSGSRVHDELTVSCSSAIEEQRHAWKVVSRSVKAAKANTITVKQVKDPTLLTDLDDLTNSVGEHPRYAACGADAGNDVLERERTNAETSTRRLSHLSERLDSTLDKIMESRAAKTLDDAMVRLDTSMQRARTILADSKGRVADERTRKELQKAIDAASSLDKSKDPVALDKAAKTLDTAAREVKESVESKRKADQAKRDAETAKREADEQARAQAQAQSPAGPPSYTPSTPAPQHAPPAASAPAPSQDSGGGGWSVPEQGSDPLPGNDSGL